MLKLIVSFDLFSFLSLHKKWSVVDKKRNTFLIFVNFLEEVNKKKKKIFLRHETKFSLNTIKGTSNRVSFQTKSVLDIYLT